MQAHSRRYPLVAGAPFHDMSLDGSNGKPLEHLRRQRSFRQVRRHAAQARSGIEAQMTGLCALGSSFAKCSLQHSMSLVHPGSRYRRCDCLPKLSGGMLHSSPTQEMRRGRRRWKNTTRQMLRLLAAYDSTGMQSSRVQLFSAC